MPERVCQRPGCGNPIRSSRRRDARWCSRSCEGKARRSAARRADFEAEHPGSAELLAVEDRSLAELHERARPPRPWADLEAEDAWAEQDRRINAMLAEDRSHRHARSHKPLRRPWELFRGVEDPRAAQDRGDRHRAEQRDVRARLTSSPGQPESRFNDATRGAVASRGAESRQLNRRAAMRTPAPSAAHGYVFSAPEPAAPPRPGAPRDEDYFRY
jgi:hypothetical protein